MRYAQIVFMQNSQDADEPLRILDEQGVQAAIDYLAQWDNGDRDEVRDRPSAGSRDNTKRVGEYLLTWNWGLGYIGLERIIEGED